MRAARIAIVALLTACGSQPRTAEPTPKGPFHGVLLPIGDSITANGKWVGELQSLVYYYGGAMEVVGTRGSTSYGARWSELATYPDRGLVYYRGLHWVAAVEAPTDPPGGSTQWIQPFVGPWSEHATYRQNDWVTWQGDLFGFARAEYVTSVPGVGPGWYRVPGQTEAVSGRTAVWFATDQDSALSVPFSEYLRASGIVLGPHDIATIFLGANDAYREHSELDAAARIWTMAQDIESTTGATVYVMPPLPPNPNDELFADTYPKTRDEYETHRQAYAAELRTYPLRFIDTDTLELTEDEYGDALHPNPAGYARIAALVRAELDQ